jgi:hypothetical protein
MSDYGDSGSEDEQMYDSEGGYSSGEGFAYSDGEPEAESPVAKGTKVGAGVPAGPQPARGTDRRPPRPTHPA